MNTTITSSKIHVYYPFIYNTHYNKKDLDMNIGDFIDKLITAVLGLIVIVFGLLPSLFIKNEESLNKLNRMKMVFIIGGMVLIFFSIIQILHNPVHVAT